MRALASLFVALWICFGGLAHADQVTPNDRVTNGVVIRAEPSTSSARLGLLLPGEGLEFSGDVSGWYEVTLADGRTGYVIKRWTARVASASPTEPMVIMSAPAPAAAAATFRIHVIDVGTGLAIFVEGRDFTLIYDGGSNDDRATGEDNRLWRYLRAVRPDLREINHLILSHPHRDHLELLPDIFDNYDVDAVWDSGALNDTCGYRYFLERVAREQDVIYRNALVNNARHRVTFNECGTRGSVQIDAGARITSEPVRLGTRASMQFLYIDGSPHADPNENSLVVRLDLGAQRILLMGDAEAGARASPTTAPSPGSIEATLLDCCEEQVAANILVVGHHGSLTSSRVSFLDAVGATDYVISSGPFPYKSRVLPDRAVLRLLRDRAAASGGAVWTTRENDRACRTDRDKIGPDNDRRPGGCDNIHIDIDADGSHLSYYREGD